MLESEARGIGRRIKMKRAEHGMSMQDVADLMDVNKTSVMRWENGDTGKIKLAIIEKLAQVLRTTPAYLMGWENCAADILPYRPPVKVPIIGDISAGLPSYADEEPWGGYVPAYLPRGGDYFALRVNGDSMSAARIEDGDIIIARRQDTVNNGEIAVVLINGETATVKQFFYEDGLVTLVPMSQNPTHRMQVYELDKADVRVIGKVVKVEFDI